MLILLLCSAVMSAAALLYMGIMPLIAKRCSEKWRYYAWLIIVAGLIIPYRPQFGSSALIKIDISKVIWRQELFIIWLIGMALFFACHFINYFRFVKTTDRWSKNITDEKILDIFWDLKTEMKIKKQIGLKMCPVISSPMLVGLINPRILLPEADLKKDELWFIIKHELVHCKRKDLLYKWLMLTAAGIHWFNPFVYLISRAVESICEISCDIEIVNNENTEMRRSYGEIIINMLKYQSKINTKLSTGFYKNKKSIKNRIAHIMDTNKKKTGAVIPCGMLAAVLGMGLIVTITAVAPLREPVLSLPELLSIDIPENAVVSCDVVPCDVVPCDDYNTAQITELLAEQGLVLMRGSQYAASRLENEQLTLAKARPYKNLGDK